MAFEKEVVSDAWTIDLDLFLQGDFFVFRSGI